MALDSTSQASSAGGNSVSLMGFDPFSSISSGKRDLDMDGYGADEEVDLPAWATDWADSPKKCEPGEQCLGTDTPNMLGRLGKWVMTKTAPHYNTALDRNKAKNCMGLPGWAIEECQRARSLEANLDSQGKPSEKESGEASEEGEEAGEEAGDAEERGRPMSLASVGRHPAVRRSLWRRRAAIRASQRALRTA